MAIESKGGYHILGDFEACRLTVTNCGPQNELSLVGNTENRFRSGGLVQNFR